MLKSGFDLFMSHDQISNNDWFISNPDSEWSSCRGSHFLFVVNIEFDPIRGGYLKSKLFTFFFIILRFMS